MLRSAQPSQFSTYPSQYIDTPGLAVLKCLFDAMKVGQEVATIFAQSLTLLDSEGFRVEMPPKAPKEGKGIN